MNRFREAREYMGLSLMEVAGFLSADIDDVANMEAGGSHDFAPYQMDALSRLYCRPLPWLNGEPVPPVQVPADLAQLMEDRELDDNDRREVVAFIEFLAHRRPATGADHADT